MGASGRPGKAVATPWPEKVLLALACALVIVSTVFCVSGVGNETVLDSTMFLGALLAFACVWMRSRLGGSLRLLLFGQLLWAAAEGVWLFQDAVLGKGDFAISAGDVLWVPAYLFFLLFFLKQFRAIGGKARKAKYALLLPTLAVSLFLVNLLILSPNFSNPGISAPDKALNAFYVVVDALILPLVLTDALLLGGGLQFVPRMASFIGFFFLLAADFLYFTDSAHSLTTFSGIESLGWNLFYAFLAAGQLLELRALRKAATTPEKAQAV